MNNLLVTGALNALKEKGLTIPGDIALIGWDDFDAAPHLEKPLSVVERPAYAMGSIVAENSSSLPCRVTGQPSRQQKQSPRVCSGVAKVFVNSLWPEFKQLKDPNSYQLKLMSPVVSPPPLIADESEIPNGLILPEWPRRSAPSEL